MQAFLSQHFKNMQAYQGSQSQQQLSDVCGAAVTLCCVTQQRTCRATASTHEKKKLAAAAAAAWFRSAHLLVAFQCMHQG